MPAFERQQANFIDTINNGPDALDPAIFAGPVDRIMLGLMAHANTISHARLVALEQTFPRTRNMMGDEDFNRVSREFCQSATARRHDINGIGEAFIPFLENRINDQSITDLANIEWAWLKSYNSADAPALTLEQLSRLDQSAMLNMTVNRHPAAHYVRLHAPHSPELSELDGYDVGAAILITRPDAETRLLPIDHSCMNIFEATKNPILMSNLLTLAIEQGGTDAPLDPIIILVGAGALLATGQVNEEISKSL